VQAQKQPHRGEAAVSAHCVEKPRRSRLIGMFADGPEALFFQAASRGPIGDGYLTESIGGTPVAQHETRISDFLAWYALRLKPEP
jgi:hypothetical protein